LFTEFSSSIHREHFDDQSVGLAVVPVEVPGLRGNGLADVPGLGDKGFVDAPDLRGNGLADVPGLGGTGSDFGGGAVTPPGLGGTGGLLGGIGLVVLVGGFDSAGGFSFLGP